MKVYIQDTYNDKGEVKGKLYLESDPMQFIIKEYTGKVTEKGAELYNTFGFYGSLEGAVKGLIKFRLLNSTAATLEELIQDVRSLKAEIEKAIAV